MKIVYRNGQKFIITDALYEARRTKTSKDPNQLSFDLDMPKLNIDDELFSQAYKESQGIVWYIMLRAAQESKATKLIKQTISNDVGENTLNLVCQQFYPIISKNKNIILQSIKDDKITSKKELVSQIVTAMRGLVSQECENSDKVNKSIQKIVNTIKSGVTADQVGTIMGSIERAIRQDNFPWETLTNNFGSNDTKNVTQNEKNTIIVSYYIDDEKKETISYDNNQESLKEFLLASIQQNKDYKIEKNKIIQPIVDDLVISVGKDNIKFEFTSESEQLKKFTFDILKPSCIEMVKEFTNIFNNDENINIKIVVNGQEQEDANVWDATQENKTFVKLPDMILNTKYEINKPIRRFFEFYQESIKNNTTKGKTTFNYNYLVKEISKKLDSLNAALSKEPTNKNWVNDLVYLLVSEGISANTPNKEVMKKISDCLKNKQETSIDGMDIVDKVEYMYKAKKIVDEIKINDYYTMQQIVENITSGKNITASNITAIKRCFGLERLTDESMDYNSLYEEFIYVNLLSNIFNGFISKNKESMNDKQLKALKQKIQKGLQKETSLNRNANLKKFIQLSGHTPNIQIDKEAYSSLVNTINQYRKEMKQVEKIFINGVSEYGIFSQELSIRPIKMDKYEKLLKNEVIKNSKIKDAMSYSYLTNFYNDIKGNVYTNRGDKNLQTVVKKIVGDDSNEKITFKFISESILREMLIFTDIDMQDFIAGFKENDEFLDRFNVGSIRYGEEGKGDKVYTIPIISKTLNNECIGIIRVRKIFAKTRRTLNKMFKHDIFKKMFNDIKRR